MTDHRLNEYGTTNCPVERVRANVDDGECSACGAAVSCICGADEPCTGHCDKHDRDLHGYPCGECQAEWREANPEKAAQIERLVRSTLRSKR